MKMLTLIRHGKSATKESGMGDFDRNLNERGREDAGLMGTVLGALFPVPGIILGSSAQRVEETIAGMLDAASRDGTRYPMPETKRDLYLSDAAIIWDFAYSALLEADEVWLCGHNPGITEAIEQFSGAGIDDVPTLGIARIAFEEVLPSPSLGELYFYDVPKNHRS
ncbi:MAG: histidine phosphatase family protein [Spirochaeta sp.]|jgi:phosphohistidine phosphatase|nr:histidine phosphatase family protein [Spirochaeta sp.]